MNKILFGKIIIINIMLKLVLIYVSLLYKNIIDIWLFPFILHLNIFFISIALRALVKSHISSCNYISMAMIVTS